jgi:hypothetical protein
MTYSVSYMASSYSPETISAIFTTAKASVDERLFRLHAGQLFDLFERRLQRRAIIGIAARRVAADYLARF